MVHPKFGNLKKEHILKAIRALNNSPDLLSKHRWQTTYKLCYGGKNYPPKGIISLVGRSNVVSLSCLLRADGGGVGGC